MASKEIVVSLHSKQDRECIARFVYDVLVYTLPKCGLDETEIPPTDFKENDYGFSNFIERFGVSVLGISLSLRDTLKQIFDSRRKNTGIHNEDIPRFLQGAIACCLVSKLDPLMPLVMKTLAVCKEFILYFCSHQIPFDLNIVIATTAYVILFYAGWNRNVLNTIEEFVNRGEYWSENTNWITSFISKHDIPFGCTEHITKLFFEEFENFILIYVESIQHKCFISVKEKFDEISDLLVYIRNFGSAFIEYVDIVVKSEVYKELRQKFYQSTGLSTFTASSETTTIGVENSNVIGSNVSIQTAQLGQNCNKSSELAIEDDLRRMHLDNERTSHERQGAIPKQRKSHKNKKKR